MTIKISKTVKIDEEININVLRTASNRFNFTCLNATVTLI